jgi:hypothetical protein
LPPRSSSEGLGAGRVTGTPESKNLAGRCRTGAMLFDA